MNFAIVIPARKGSKSIKNKNLIKIKNKPLIQYTFDQIKNIKIPKFILSNDDDIKLLAKKNKINSSYLRPSKTSTSKSSLVETLLHFANWSIDKYAIDYLVILQPTSPLRTTNDINGAIKLTLKNRYKSLFSISESIEHPYETIDLYKKNSWKYVLKDSNKFYRRQDFDINSYFINGAIYIISKNYLIKNKSIISNKHGLYQTSKSRSLDINDKDDLIIAKKIL
jgi:CMP-N,N'-diacetyllegionaminic acid synthase